MVVLGLLDDGVDPATLSVGAEVELVLGTLYEDADHEYVVWKWRPIPTAHGDRASGAAGAAP
jgi:hypothetical protein